ncbi:MAG: hypothetical protein LBR53_09800 [Deltaproteobacteria bacterium]|nr:hypothetical protein [Deltaproteobacteria bacterium]
METNPLIQGNYFILPLYLLSAGVIAFNQLEKTLPAFFTRQEASRLAGGIFTAESPRNLDCSNKGPEREFGVGEKISYEKGDLFSGLRSAKTE